MAKMDLADAVKLDRDMTRIRESEAICVNARNVVRTYDVEATEILKKYEVDLASFNNNQTIVDYVTGEIKRPKTSPTEPKLPPKK